MDENEKLQQHEKLLKEHRKQLDDHQKIIDDHGTRLSSAESRLDRDVASIVESNKWLRQVLSDQTKMINDNNKQQVELNVTLQRNREDRLEREAKLKEESKQQMYKLIGIAIGGGGVISLAVQLLMQYLS